MRENFHIFINYFDRSLVVFPSSVQAPLSTKDERRCHLANTAPVSTNTFGFRSFLKNRIEYKSAGFCGLEQRFTFSIGRVNLTRNCAMDNRFKTSKEYSTKLLRSADHCLMLEHLQKQTDKVV